MKTRLGSTSVFTLIVFFSLFLLVGNQVLSAQETSATPAPTPENEELKKLKQQNEILAEQQKAAEAQKAIAEANKAIAEANKVDLPKPTATPLEGKTELEGVKIETEMMSYRALRRVAGEIASQVNRKIKAESKVAILNDQWLLALRDYWGTRNKVKFLEKSYQGILEFQLPSVPVRNFNDLLIGQIVNGPPKPIPPLPIAVAMIKPKINLKTTKKVKGNVVFEEILPTMSAMKVANDSDVSSVTNKGGSFKSTVSAITNTIGGVGSIVGAAIDLMALARTDTKITGFSFTPQESALVSSVYANLKSEFRYYPAEFSPNLNLQNPSAVITDVQAVADLRDRAANLLGNIDDAEKALKELNGAKESLEARKKQLPLDIAAAKKKLDELRKIRKKENDLEVKIIEQQEKLDALNEENAAGLPKKIKKNFDSIEKLELKLSQLYKEIEPAAASGRVVNGFLDIADELDKVSAKLLENGRPYAFEEIIGLTNGDKAVFKLLVDEAEKRKGGLLSPTEKEELLNPYEMDRLKTFVKVGEYMRRNRRLPSQLEPHLFLSDVEQLKLAYLLDEDFLLNKSKTEKSRANKIVKLKSLNTQFDKFYEELIKPDTLGINPITKHLQSENMMDAFGCDKKNGNCSDAYALVVKVVDVGGNNRTKKNLLTMAITGSDITHSGGAIVEYKFYDLNGKILNSGICTGYESYEKAENINNPKTKGQNIVSCQVEQENTNSQQQNQNADPEAAKDNQKKSAGKSKPELKKPE